MDKKYLFIRGSGRQNGYTNKISEELIDFIGSDNVTVFDTYKEEFSPCNGCNYCETQGKCVNRDLDGFFEAFENCDRVIFFAPIYNGSFSAPMKSLIDRFQFYYTSFYHNNKAFPIAKKRKAYLVCASGRDDKRSFEYMQGQLSCAFTILNMNLEESFLCANTDAQPNYLSVVQSVKRSLSND